ncbi:MAG: DUF192 domain-containing protein [Arenicellales bacterium]
MRPWLLAALLVALNAHGACRESTPALNSMTGAELTLEGPAGQAVRLRVRVADDNTELAGGFQYVCPDTIAKTSIYFVFDHPLHPTFHMHNVEAPLDIAFIDADGVIVNIQRMEPYVLGAAHYRYYSPPGEVTAALETRAGYFAEKQVTVGDWKVEASR